MTDCESTIGYVTPATKLDGKEVEVWRGREETIKRESIEQRLGGKNGWAKSLN